MGDRKWEKEVVGEPRKATHTEEVPSGGRKGRSREWPAGKLQEGATQQTTRNIVVMGSNRVERKRKRMMELLVGNRRLLPLTWSLKVL